MEWIETTGASLDEAKDRALDRLGVAEDEVEIEVLEEGSRSMFGLKKTEARIRARVRPTSARPKVDRRERNRRNGGGRNGQKGRGRGDRGQTSKRGDPRASDASNDRQQKDDHIAAAASGSNSGSVGGRSRRRGRGRGQAVEGTEVAVEQNSSHGSDEPVELSMSDSGGSKEGSVKEPARDNGRGSDRERAEVEAMDLQTQARITEEFVQGLLDKMGLEARVASTIEEDRLTVEAQGLNLGLAIGQRGETVRAITELSRTLIQRSSDGQAEGSLTVDIGGYRERRRSFLADFARGQGEAVLADGQARALEPMGAADRKVVHDTIADIDGLSTISEGSDADRRVVISLIRD